ncbi:MAG: SEC-C domain-containing protein [Desulfuromonadales bacterium]|nr:SEC-C domain-containing protein [Desulfuromonadales bacterium]
MGMFSRFFKSESNDNSGPIPPEVLPLRNDMCWCGSGLKYKKCHLDKDQVYLENKRQKELAAKKACSPVYG